MDLPADKVTDVYPRELHHVRALFLHKQHRRCITACRELLGGDDASVTEQPLRRIFLQFYLALAHDELARTIHSYSRLKIPAVRLAQQMYRDANTSLPTAEQCAQALVKPDIIEEETSSSEDEEINWPCPPSSTGATGESRLESMYSPPTKHVRDGLSPPPVDSPLASLSDQDDDLESHDSFNQIMTPNRLPTKLPRDYSSMSLLQPDQRPRSYMPPSTSGFQIAQQPLTTPSYANRWSTPSRLPRLNTTSLPSSSVQKQLRTKSEQVSPVEPPVSPMGSDSVDSDASTISPISPSTPTAILGSKPQTKLRTLTDHLSALRQQIERHVQLLEEEEKRVSTVQFERTVFRPTMVAKEEGLSPLPASQTFWSFTPKDVKVCEKQNRIAAGRVRNWKKERFDPSRYKRLAEMAMQEL